MRVVVIFFLMVLALTGHSQIDTSYLSTSASYLKKQYLGSLNKHQHLYEGSKYIIYAPVGEEHPYLYEDWSSGTVTYDGMDYPVSALLVDLSLDEIIIEHFSGAAIQLVKGRVNEFTIKGRKFIHLRNGNLPEGFYEVPYQGSSQILVKRRKVLIESIKLGKLEREFDEKNSVYLLRENKYIPLRSKRDLWLYFNIPDVKKVARQNGLKFKETWGTDIVKLASLYDNSK